MDDIVLKYKENYIQNLDTAISSLSKLGIPYAKNEDYEFEKSGSQQELCQPRTDIYSQLKLITSPTSLYEEYTK